MRRFLNGTERSHAVTQRNNFSDATTQNMQAESSIALAQGSLLQINMRKSCLIFRKRGIFVSVWNEMNRLDLVKIKGQLIIHSRPPKSRKMKVWLSSAWSMQTIRTS